jgi:hypothetical protein
MVRIRGVSISKEDVASPMIHVTQIMMLKYNNNTVDHSQVCRMTLPSCSSSSNWKHEDITTTDDDDEY